MGAWLLWSRPEEQWRIEASEERGEVQSEGYGDPGAAITNIFEKTDMRDITPEPKGLAGTRLGELSPQDQWRRCPNACG